MRAAQHPILGAQHYKEGNKTARQKRKTLVVQQPLVSFCMFYVVAVAAAAEKLSTWIGYIRNVRFSRGQCCCSTCTNFTYVAQLHTVRTRVAVGVPLVVRSPRAGGPGAAPRLPTRAAVDSYKCQIFTSANSSYRESHRTTTVRRGLRILVLFSSTSKNSSVRVLQYPKINPQFVDYAPTADVVPFP